VRKKDQFYNEYAKVKEFSVRNEEVKSEGWQAGEMTRQDDFFL
jgi:hypothetical protein